jgi:tubulin-folding cofactor B
MSVVKVTLFHPATKATVMEKRVQLSDTISRIKAICSTHFQTSVEDMKIRLIDGATGCSVADSSVEDERQLGYYRVADGWTIECVDVRGDKASYIGMGGQAELEKVEKFEISDADYVKISQVRAFKQQMMEKQRQEAIANGEAVPEQLTDSSFQEEASKINVGDRCQVFPGDRLATVRYVGRLGALKPGFWIGVEFDEPVGKNDGKVKGQTVFECRPNYGGFVRPKDVTVGDFPPEDF